MAEVSKKDIQEIVNGAVDKLALAVSRGFEDVDQRFDSINGRLGRMEARLSHIDGRLGDNAKEHERIWKSIDRSTGAVDGFALKADAYFKELAAMQNAFRRDEKWIEQLAKKVRVKLET